MGTRFLSFSKPPSKKWLKKLPLFKNWRNWLANAIVHEARMRAETESGFLRILLVKDFELFELFEGEIVIPAHFKSQASAWDY